MKIVDAKSVHAEAAPLSDAEVVAALANSNWERMERDSQNVISIEEFRDEDPGESRCA
jgi:hypothetical protein